MAARFKDYYQTMGVERSASGDEIKRAYRKLARKYHPDVSKEANAEERFKEVGEAYEVLKDPEKRAAYDQLGANWQAGEEFTPPPGWQQAGGQPHGEQFTDASQFSDFFESLFGGGFRHTRGNARRRGEDQHAAIELSLEDAFHGATRALTLNGPEYGADGTAHMGRRTLQVKIPAGVLPGQHIRLAGQGAPGSGGSPNGDLYLEIRLTPHALFEIEGRDVYLNLPVAPWEAALGAKLTSPTLGGEVELTIPPGSQSGQKLRLRGRGFPGNPPGDQYVRLQIVNPKIDSEDLKELYRKMAREIPFNPRAAMRA